MKDCWKREKGRTCETRIDFYLILKRRAKRRGIDGIQPGNYRNDNYCHSFLTENPEAGFYKQISTRNKLPCITKETGNQVFVGSVFSYTVLISANCVAPCASPDFIVSILSPDELMIMIDPTCTGVPLSDLNPTETASLDWWINAASANAKAKPHKIT